MTHPRESEGLKDPSITAFFPAYNDRHTIEGIVLTAAEELSSVTDDFEILVVNDGSGDDTGALLESLRGLVPQLRVIHHERNRGYGAALITGFTNASKDLIFYTDGDGQYDVREVHNLLSKLGPSVDLVNGYKVKRADSWYRILIGAAYRYTIRFAFHLSIRDVDCDFRLFRRRILDSIALETPSGAICVEIARKFDDAGFHAEEVAVSHYPRLHGSSEFFRFRHIAKTVTELFRVWRELVLAPRLLSVAGYFRIQPRGQS